MADEVVDQAEGTPSSESTAQAIEDKLTKQFEQAEARTAPAKPAPAAKADAEEEPGKTEPEFEEIEFEGEKYQVPPKLKEGFIHKADYTRKTQEVADARRQIELQAEAFKVQQAENTFAQSIEEPLRNLSILEARTRDLLANWQTLNPDQKSELLYLDKQRDMINQDIRGKRGLFDQEQNKALGELQRKCADAVRKAIPNWSEAVAKSVTDHAVNDGYTQQELSNLSDPRYIRTLWKAQEFDRLQALAKAAPQKVAPVIKAGPQNPMPQGVKDNFAFNKEMAKARTSSEKARLIEEKFARQFSKQR